MEAIQTEKQIDNEVHAAFNRGGTRLFKNVNGNFWQGAALTDKLKYARIAAILGLAVRFVILLFPRRVQAGVGGVGGSDRIGFHQITITESMIGKKIAVFCAIELKTSDGIVTPEQKQFVKVVSDMGGIAGVARIKKDIEILFDSFVGKLQS